MGEVSRQLGHCRSSNTTMASCEPLGGLSSAVPCARAARLRYIKSKERTITVFIDDWMRVPEFLLPIYGNRSLKTGPHGVTSRAIPLLRANAIGDVLTPTTFL